MATVKGIFVLNDFLQLPPFDTYYVNFKSEDKSYTCFSIVNSRTLYYKYQDGGTYTYSFGSDTWTNNVYKTIDFGTTPQEVSDDFYTWLTANATQQGEEEPTATATITYNGNVIATITDGQTATLPCDGKKMVGDIVIAYVGESGGSSADATHALYNGVRLPKIPEDVLAEYPYCWIRKHTTNGQYQLMLSATGFYYANTGLYDKERVTNPQYTFPIGETTDTEWINANNTTYSAWTVDDARPCMWSNHDIPNGSATSTDIYFYGSDPVPINQEVDTMALEIKYNGNVIATLEKGQTATIPCDGKVMATDLVVSISASVNLISFTIGGITYQAEQGMTWGEWQASGYNKAGVDKSLKIDGLSVAWDTGYAVSSSDAIVAGHQYYLPVGDIGGSN